MVQKCSTTERMAATAKPRPLVDHRRLGARARADYIVVVGSSVGRSFHFVSFLSCCWLHFACAGFVIVLMVHLAHCALLTDWMTDWWERERPYPPTWNDLHNILHIPKPFHGLLFSTEISGNRNSQSTWKTYPGNGEREIIFMFYKRTNELMNEYVD